MPRVLNKYHDVIPKDAVYVGRPSKFGNPYILGEHGTRNGVIRLYEKYLLSNPTLLAAVREELAGKDLVCHCSPKKCHGDILLRIANPPTSIFEA